MLFYTKILPIALIVLTAIVASYRFNANSYKFKIVAVICFITAVVEIAGHWLGSKNINNVWLYNISDLVRYELWLYFFYCLSNSIKEKNVILFLLVFYLVVWLCNVIAVQPFTIFQTNSFIIGGLFILALSVLYFIDEYKNDNANDLFTQPEFWFCSGLIIYHAATQPFLGMYNWLYIHYPTLSKNYFHIGIIGSSLLLSITIIIGFICSRQTKK